MESDPTILNLPPPFNYYRLISDSDHLHFGLWPDDESEPASVAEALEAMLVRLISFLPAPPARVLDVGCGLGLSAHLLRIRGFDVTAIAPSPELIGYATRRYGTDGPDFRVLGFFDSDPEVFEPGRYDALLFQESLQNLHPLHEAMRKARGLLRDGGTIVIGDEVCYDDALRGETAVHMARDIYAGLSEHGFRILENEQLGQRVLPTCEAALKGLTERFGDIVSLMDDPDAERNLRFFFDGWKKQTSWHRSGRFGYETFAGRKDGFAIRPYMAGDEDDIVPLFNQVFHTERGLDHWYWKYRDNPYGSHRISVGISPEGEVVSHYAGYPIPFCSTIEGGGTPCYFLTVHAGDTFTHPKVRRIGLGKTGLLARTTFYYYAKFLEGFVPFAFGFNTAVIKQLGERYLGYQFGDPVVQWAKDLSKDRSGRPGLLDAIFSGFRAEEVFCVNDEWDDFFSRVSPSYGFLVKRDARYLAWRYLNCPDKAYRLFTVRRRGTMVGWSVFAVSGRRLIWGDALFDNRFLDGASFLLRHAAAACSPPVEGIDAWFSRNPSWWPEHLGSIGFEAAPQPDGLTLCYRTFRNTLLSGDAVTERLRDHFYYTRGDSDLF
jgi:SAM-dependent methyltransferase